ncbi:MAG: VWA domain-containing protein [Clostridia bacterium]|nr:VWA domain-containing protein [Clostridia bacterium]
MKKNLTEIVFILDRSGSMRGLEADTIGGYNSMLDKQREEEGEAYVSTVLFDDVPEIIHDRVQIDKIKDITGKEYYVRGCTALLDAVGGAIHHIAHIHKYAREEDVPEKTIFIITTDGMENASRTYTYEKVKSMIEHEKEKYGWEFIFLGANIDAAAVGARMGISEDRSVQFTNDETGVKMNYAAMSDAISYMRTSSKPLNNKWRKAIDEDQKKRKRLFGRK